MKIRKHSILNYVAALEVNVAAFVGGSSQTASFVREGRIRLRPSKGPCKLCLSIEHFIYIFYNTVHHQPRRQCTPPLLIRVRRCSHSLQVPANRPHMLEKVARQCGLQKVSVF